MKALPLHKLTPVVFTAVPVIAALMVGGRLWQYYLKDPWTRDAHVSADVVQVAPDVSGLVAEVQVHDNGEVHKGEVLFVIDPARYRIALEQARGTLAQSRASLAASRATLAQGQAAEHQLEREEQRDRELKGLVAVEEIEARHASREKAQAMIAAAQAGISAAEASIAAAQAAVELAQLNLDRTVVRAPVNGRLNDRTVRAGDYVAAGKPVLAVLDTHSFRVDGYFEETRLHGIREGDAVDIHIMGEESVLHGHVASIAAGIEDRYRSEGSQLLPNVTPSFDWVRLAQRVPVRISIDGVPGNVHLIAGRTASVSVVAPRQTYALQATRS